MNQNMFYSENPLIDYKEDVVYMSPCFSYNTKLNKPIIIKIK